MNEKGFISIARYLIYGVVAYLAVAQMVQDFQLFVQIQFIIEQQHQILKTACIHNKISNLYLTEKQVARVCKYIASFWRCDQSIRILNGLCVFIAKLCYVLVRIGVWAWKVDKICMEKLAIVLVDIVSGSRWRSACGRREYGRNLRGLKGLFKSARKDLPPRFAAVFLLNLSVLTGVKTKNIMVHSWNILLY
jgi:hypothetical protein